jgi:hypothetical protein
MSRLFSLKPAAIAALLLSLTALLTVSYSAYACSYGSECPAYCSSNSSLTGCR